jgi:segregation and condensation protein A
MSGLIVTVAEWRRLQSFLPARLREGAMARSALAATFVASLELAKSGRIELRQEARFGPIFLRAARPQA